MSVRKNPARIVVPTLAIQHEEMRLHGMETPRDRALAIQRQKRADADAATPAIIDGEIDSQTAFEQILTYLERRGLIINKTTRGGRFGDQLNNPTFINANSPLFTVKTQGTSDTASTTNTGSTVAAMDDLIVMPDGKWSVLVLGGINLGHSTGGTVGISTEIEGVEGTVRLVASVASTGQMCFAHSDAVNIQGAQDLNLRVRFRSNTSGTTTAKNPVLVTIIRRTE